jgi:hypothetical protein
MDPPDDEPPSLKIESMEENHNHVDDAENLALSSPDEKPDIDAQGFFNVEPSLDVNARNDITGHEKFPNQYNSPESKSYQNHNTYPEESQLAESNEYLQEEKLVLSNNHYFQEPFGSPKSDEHDEHFHEPSGASGCQSEVLLEEPDEPTQMEDNFPESTVLHENEDMNQEEITQHYPEENESSDDSELHDAESPYAPSNAIAEKEYYVTDEKKIGVEKDEISSELNDSDDYIKDEIEKSPEQPLTNGYPCKNIEPIDTSYTRRGGYNDDSAPSPFSPAGMSTSSGMDSRGHQSPAMRGAHEILKRNRRRRAEVSKHNNQMTSPAMSVTPETTKSENNRTEVWDDGSDITGSAISGSSVWTDNSGTGDRSSRRALILQMAKARMKNNKESPKVPSEGNNHDIHFTSDLSSAITEEDNEADDTIFTEGNATHDIDLTGDLD